LSILGGKNGRFSKNPILSSNFFAKFSSFMGQNAFRLAKFIGKNVYKIIT
jgi:hypothetical protein